MHSPHAADGGAPHHRLRKRRASGRAAGGILDLDFFTTDLLNGTKAYVLVVIEHGTRRARVPDAAGHPVQSWVVQQARNLLMGLEDAGMSMKFVLHDRDASFTAAFAAVFQAAPLRPLPDAVTGLDHFHVRRRNRADGMIHEYRLVA